MTDTSTPTITERDTKLAELLLYMGEAIIDEDEWVDRAATMIAADREEEREDTQVGIDALKECVGDLRDERDALETENAKLRDALETIRATWPRLR